VKERKKERKKKKKKKRHAGYSRVRFQLQKEVNIAATAIERA
jgi:hypothetical protein